jgi:hypothetical protein
MLSYTLEGLKGFRDGGGREQAASKEPFPDRKQSGSLGAYDFSLYKT